MFVRSLRIRDLTRANESLLLRPAAIHPLEAPIGASLRGADWPAVNKHKDRIGMRGREDTEGDPTALIERGFERNFLKTAVGLDSLFRHRIAVHYEFHRNCAGVPDARALHVPVWFLIEPAESQDESSPDEPLDNEEKIAIAKVGFNRVATAILITSIVKIVLR